MARHIKRIRTFPLLLLLPFLALPHSTYAHNGAVALAAPVEGIVIDGDLSDWPSDLPRYPLTHTESGVPPSGPGDLSATFQVGYDAAGRSLYVAVDVVDESVIIDTSDARNWDTEDGCEVYLGSDHTRGLSGSTQYILRGNGTPEQRLAGVATRRVHWQRSEGGHRYEWRLPLPEAVGVLTPGVSIPIDVVVCDKDTDGSFTWITWGPKGYKIAVEKLGDFVLTKSPIAAGSIAGRAVRQGTDQGITGITVRLSPTAAAADSITLKTDSEGRFSTALPNGQYDVILVWGQDQSLKQQIEVSTDNVTELTFDVPPSTGSRQPAGDGEVVRVGDGRRSNGWHILTTADGLPSSNIFALHQDDDGVLWLGTSGGLSRYDGRNLTTYTTLSGLPSDNVFAIARDPAGNLWLGTNVGLVRYDGESFTSYDTRDGLIHHWVKDILPRQDGSLWLATGGGLSRFDGQYFSNWTAVDGLPGNSVEALDIDDSDRLWIGTRFGLARLDGDTFEVYTEKSGLPGRRIQGLYRSADGVLWIGTATGLSRYDGRTFTNFGADDGLTHSREYNASPKTQTAMCGSPDPCQSWVRRHAYQARCSVTTAAGSTRSTSATVPLARCCGTGRGTSGSVRRRSWPGWMPGNSSC
jgi:hypothetical protein